MAEQSAERVVAAIGVFDGVHRGHRVLLERARQMAAERAAVPAVVTFDPPPVALFAPSSEPFEITPREAKVALLGELGIGCILMLPFTSDLAALSPGAFVRRALRARFDLAGVVVGHDFSFGAGRAGDPAKLGELGRELGFAVEVIAPVEIGGLRVSSTRIRAALRCGAVAEAARLLGSPLRISGQVVSGRGLGSAELVPTANLEVSPAQLLPAAGVYAVEVIAESRRCPGVAHVGPALTLGAGDERLIEVHLLDYSGDLRGARLQTGFVAWLRESRRFPDLAGLRRAINEDIAAARDHFARRRRGRGGGMRLVSVPPL